MCAHWPSCPNADESAHDAARVVVAVPEQGWSLLCNGVVTFDDNGELLPDGRVTAPRVCAGLTPAARPEVPVAVRASAA